jgi:Na+(H+)/acetate symporter ActP
MSDLFILTFVLNASGAIAIGLAILMVVCLFGGMGLVRWWIAMIIAIGLAIGANTASRASLEAMKNTAQIEKENK